VIKDCFQRGFRDRPFLGVDGAVSATAIKGLGDAAPLNEWMHHLPCVGGDLRPRPAVPHRVEHSNDALETCGDDRSRAAPVSRMVEQASVYPVTKTGIRESAQSVHDAIVEAQPSRVLDRAAGKSQIDPGT
jgi:hypothetical protein